MPLAVAQWLFVLLLSRSVPHNGWLYSRDGDFTSSYAAAWSLAHGRIPAVGGGFGWPLLVAPIAAVAGPTVLDALPAIVLVQTLVLLPVALACMYGIGLRLGGRAIGYLAAGCWVVLPYVAARLFNVDFHSEYVDSVMPQALGLTGDAELPALVFTLVAAYFVVASLTGRGWRSGALAGLASGFAVAVEPAAALFLAAPAVAYVAARRWRTLLAFGVAFLPLLGAYLLWRYRALGDLPPVTVDVDLHRLEVVRLDFRSVFYSDRLVEVTFVAGAIAVARRSWAAAAFLTAWGLAFLLVRGSDELVRVADGSVFRVLMPGIPAFALACAALPLLAPRLGARLVQAARRSWPTPSAWFAVPFLGLAAVALVLFAVLPKAKPSTLLVSPDTGALVAVDESFRADARATSDGVELRWPERSTRANVVYDVLRCGDAGCVVRARAVTKSPYTFVDAPGRRAYRVAVAATGSDPKSQAKLVLVSPPVDVGGG